MGTQLTKNHLGITPVAFSQLHPYVGPLQLNIYPFNPDSKWDQVLKANPIHIGTNLWAPMGTHTFWDHLGATLWAPILSQTLIHPKIT